MSTKYFLNKQTGISFAYFLKTCNLDSEYLKFKKKKNFYWLTEIKKALK